MEKLLVKDAKNALVEILQRYKFNFDKPDFETAFYAFKEYMSLEFDTQDDLMFYESELSALTGEMMFQISFVRQFADANNKCRQLQLDIFYEPLDFYKDADECIWLDDYNTKEEFYTNVLSSKSFAILAKHDKPIRSELYFDNKD